MTINRKYTVEQNIGGIIDSFPTIAVVLREQVLDRATIDGNEILKLADTLDKYAEDLSGLIGEMRKNIMTDTTKSKFSTPSKLFDLEEVINTRTPVWDIEGSGDVRIKLDTDVNGQEWYVIQDDSSRGEPFEGIAYCWAFPHFNGAHDQYCYIPVAFCYKTFGNLLEAHPTNRAMWAYDLEEYARRVKMLNG